MQNRKELVEIRPRPKVLKIKKKVTECDSHKKRGLMIAATFISLIIIFIILPVISLVNWFIINLMMLREIEKK